MQIAIISLINKVIAAAGEVLTVLFSLLPDSPFIYVLELENTWIEYINYIIPVAGIIAHLELFLVAVAIYYVLRIPLRWVKGVD